MEKIQYINYTKEQQRFAMLHICKKIKSLNKKGPCFRLSITAMIPILRNLSREGNEQKEKGIHKRWNQDGC